MDWQTPLYFLANLAPPPAAASPPDAASTPNQAQLAIVLFEVFVVLMGLFLFVITFLMLRRIMRRRGSSCKKEDTQPMPDPWQESGNRLKP